MKIIGALALTLAVATAAQAAAPLAVSGAWSRPAVAGTNGVGYLIVTNHGKADTLVKVESPLAARIEMHSSSMAGGVMSMKMQDRLAVPAGGKLAFGPGGYHLMLIGLTKTLKAGDQVPATLTFASGATVKTTLAVGMGAAPASMDHMPH